MEQLSLRLKDLRKEHKISQAELAKKIGVSKAIVCYWETNQNEPTGSNLVKLADFFDISVDYLLGRVDY